MKKTNFLMIAIFVIVTMSFCSCSDKPLNLTAKGEVEKIYRDINNEKKIIVDIRNDGDKLLQIEVNSAQDISTIYEIKIGNYAYAYQLGSEKVISSMEMTPQRKEEYLSKLSHDKATNSTIGILSVVGLALILWLWFIAFKLSSRNEHINSENEQLKNKLRAYGLIHDREED